MQQAVATRQAKLDENLARMDQAIAAADQLKYISNSEDEAYVTGELRPAIQNLAQTYATQDLSDPTVYNAMLSEMRTSIDKNRVQAIQESYGNYMQNQAIKQRLRAQGKYHEALDAADPAIGYDSRTGVYNYQTEALLDLDAAAKKYFDDVKANAGFDPESGMVWSGVGETRLSRIAKENFRHFLDTNEGEQAVRIAAHRHGINLSELDPQERRAFKEAAAEDILMEKAQEFEFYREQPMSGYAGYMKSQQPDLNFDFSTSDNTTNFKVGDLEFLALPSQASGSKFSVISNPAYGGHSSIIRQDETTPEGIANRRKRIQEARDLYGIQGSDKEVADKMNNAINGINNQSLSLKSMAPMASEYQKNELLSNMGSRNYFVMSADGKSGIKLTGEGRKEGLLKELDIKMDNFEEQLEGKQMLSFTQDGPEAGMLHFEITDGKGKKRTVLASGNNQMQQYLGTSHAIGKKMRELDQTPITIGKHPETGNEWALRAVPNYRDEEGGKFDFEIEQGIMINGEFTPQGEYTYQHPSGMTYRGMDAIKVLELNKMGNSGFPALEYNRYERPVYRGAMPSLGF
jgi:hypothetical protein